MDIIPICEVLLRMQSTITHYVKEHHIGRRHHHLYDGKEEGGDRQILLHVGERIQHTDHDNRQNHSIHHVKRIEPATDRRARDLLHPSGLHYIMSWYFR